MHIEQTYHSGGLAMLRQKHDFQIYPREDRSSILR